MRFLVTILFSLIFFVIAIPTMGQKKLTVSGVVIDGVSNMPRADVSILSITKPVKEIGVTDTNGHFTVAVPVGTQLQFKIIGYKDYIYVVKSRDSIITVPLEGNNGSMQEVVVQGFKKTSKETSTGSSVILTAKDLRDVPSASVVDLLQGKVAGLNVQSNNGAPGARASVRLRGLSSIGISGSGSNAFLTPTSPLYVVDGVQIDDNANYSYGFNQAGPGVSPIAMIPVEDIEQVEVLKDAAATSQYGSRGAYGVILITTKRGKSKIPIVTYQGAAFFSAVPKLRDVIGGNGERMTRLIEILQNDSSLAHAYAQINNTPFLSDSINAYYNNSTNWQDVFYRPTYNQTHNIGINGGDQVFNYKVNLGYYQQSGIIQNTGYKRYSLNMSTLYQPSQQFRAVASIQSSLASNQKGSGVGLLQTGVASGSNTSSLLPPPSVYTENNSALAGSTVEDDNKSVYILSNLDVRWEPIKGIQFNTTGNYSLTSETSDNFKPAYVNNGQGQKTSYNGRTYQIYNRNMINFIKSFGSEQHNFNAYVFNEINVTQQRHNQIVSVGTPNNAIQGPVGNDQEASIFGTLNDSYDGRTAAFGGDFSYNFQRKYVIDFAYRADASSTSGPNAQYRKYPTISGRWNFNKEKWFEKVSWLDYGSLRASWGKSTIPSGTVFDVYGKYLPGSNFNNGQTISIDWTYAPNSSFKPQVTTQWDFGFEGSILNSKLTWVYDFYYKNNDNQTYDQTLSNIIGYSKLKTNDVSLVNYGNEITLTFRPLSTSSPFQWTLSGNAAFNKNILAKLPGGVRQLQVDGGDVDEPILYQLGGNALTNLLYNTKGVYSRDSDVPVNPATGMRMRVLTNGIYKELKAGDPIWADINGDYVIDNNDLQPLGNPQPKVTGGITSYLQYKGWSLNLNISYTLKRDVINNVLAQKFQNFADPYKLNTALLPIDQYNYWKQPGDNAQYPNPFDFLNTNTIRPFRYNQTLFLEDGSYWKLNSVTLAYSIDRKYTQRWGITSTRFYITGSNILVLSPYSGASPENVTDLGRDNSSGYPNARNYTIGVNLQF